jgi:hypothetical protein
MVSGGTRFARPGRSRTAPRGIEVEVRPPHKTLYEVLVVPPTTSSREIRKISRALRCNLPNLSDLDDVCLAEQVLGRRELRAEYDALLARAGAARLTLPQIGPAIEGTRPLGAPVVASDLPPVPPSAPFSRIGRDAADSSGDAAKLLIRVAVAAVFLIGALAKGSKHDTDHRVPDYPPIQLPRFDPPAVPQVDLHKLGLDKVDPGPPVVPRLEPMQPMQPGVEPAKPTRPQPRPAKPRKAASAPVTPAPVPAPEPAPPETP